VPSLPPVPPPAQGGFMGAATDPVKKNMSIMNPMDMAAMKQQGGFDPKAPVVDTLKKLGIDPMGPSSQLVDFAKKQIQNADMVGKMGNIAADSGQGAPAAPEPMGEPPAGLEGLLKQ
jgi:hypothetical protein